MYITTKKCLLVSSALLLASQVSAKELPASGLSTKVTLSANSTDNVLLNNKNIEDNFFVVAPELGLNSQIDQHFVSLKYNGKYALFSKETDFNYNDHNISAYALLDHTERLNTEFSIKYIDAIEDPNSNTSTVLDSSFNEKSIFVGSAKVYYGTTQSTGQLILGFDHEQRRFDNNNQSRRNVDLNRISATFYYQLAAKTRLLFQVLSAEYDYEQSPNNSSEEDIYFAGINWELTAKTTGEIKLGYQDKQFEDPNTSDVGGFSYVAEILFRPTTHNYIQLIAGKQAQESAILGQASYLSEYYTITAEHSFTDRTRLNVSYQSDDADYDVRVDTKDALTLTVKHQMREWLDLGLYYKNAERNSDDTSFIYDESSYGLNVTVSFD